jgi:uncharacterized protein YpmB
VSPIKSIFIALLVFLLLAAAAGCNLFRQAEPPPGPGEEDAADQTDLTRFTASELFTGREVHYPADFQERVMFLVYFLNG